ncbi:MAG: hypothetical protein MUO82_02275 [Candidatus Thermoplasmatota archaeon]|nr:hypothetical protein [Candidatus Thermoplasmatota archaeon]
MNDSTKGLTTEDVVRMNKKYLEADKHRGKRQGYNSFWSLVLMLFRLNRSNKKWKVKVNYTITLPVKWI